jgi:uncharacterized protein (DUF1330 family)
MSKETPVFVLIEVEVTDLQTYQLYLRQASALAPLLAHFGGKIVARSSEEDSLVVEGTLEHQRVTIMHFPSRKNALGYYQSPAYQAIAPLRHQSATTRVLILPALPER